MKFNMPPSSHAENDQELIASLLLAARLMNRHDLNMLVRLAVLPAKQAKPRCWLPRFDPTGRFMES